MLNDNIRRLLSMVAANNMPEARKAALAICANEKSSGNLRFCQRISEQIKSQFGPGMIQLPPNVKDLLIQENVPETFRPERYYLTPENKELVDKVLSMNMVSEKLAGAGIFYLNAALLTGEPGTGKTMLARHIAWKLGIPLLCVNLTRTISSYMGSSANNIGNIFAAVNSEPCVLLLDELDAISTVRGNAKESGADAEMSRVTTALMQALDYIRGEVIVLAATNRPDLIDPAVKRRFHVALEVRKMRTDEIIQMSEIFLDDAISHGSLPVSYDKEALVKFFTESPSLFTPAAATDFIVQRLAAALTENSPNITFPLPT